MATVGGCYIDCAAEFYYDDACDGLGLGAYNIDELVFVLLLERVYAVLNSFIYYCV